MKVGLFLVVWTALLAGGYVLANRYAGAAGDEASAPEGWPAAASIQRAAKGSTLIMLAHPLCPCTRASLHELERLMAKAPESTHAYVLFLIPKDDQDDPDWKDSDLWTIARRIPHTEARADVDGVEAARFGAKTSGQVVVYDERGTLRFRGGITPARGHEGDTAAQDAILAILGGAGPQGFVAPVFGCDMFGRDGG